MTRLLAVRAIVPFVILIAATFIYGQTTAFTYQGRLTDSSIPANGTYNMHFALFGVPAGGTPLASQSISGVTVNNGVFTVLLDLGDNFDGPNRYLEVTVGSTLLSPRQPVTSAPHAIRAIKAGQAEAVTGVVPIANGGTGSSTQSFVDLSTNQSNIGGNKTFTGTVSVSGASGVFSGNGSGLTNLNGANLVSQSVTSNQLAADVRQTNLSLLGSLRWDVLRPQTNFTVGNAPVGLAFDGKNMWAPNSASASVTAIRISDGGHHGTWGVFGTNPLAAAFDGVSMWVSSQGSNVVTKLRASDGACIAPCNYTVGNGPWGMAFDGANMWIANNSSGTVTKLRASDGALLGTFATGVNPKGVVFDGANIWVTNNNANTVTKLRASNGANLGSFPTGSNPGLMAFDGANIWIVNESGGSLTKLRPSDGANLGTFAISAGLFGIAFDGTNLWVSTSSTGSIVKVRTLDGTVLSTYIAVATPRSLAFDGANMWVANQLSTSITRLPPAFPE